MPSIVIHVVRTAIVEVVQKTRDFFFIDLFVVPCQRIWSDFETNNKGQFHWNSRPSESFREKY